MINGMLAHAAPDTVQALCYAHIGHSAGSSNRPSARRCTMRILGIQAAATAPAPAVTLCAYQRIQEAADLPKRQTLSHAHIRHIQTAATMSKRQTLSHAHIRHIQTAATMSKRPPLRHAHIGRSDGRSNRSSARRFAMRISAFRRSQQPPQRPPLRHVHIMRIWQHNPIKSAIIA